jgi:pyridoxal phosphate enzyme (YggS family)
LEEVRGRIAAACARAGRPIGAVQLIAVSKLQPAEQIRAAFAAGQRVFGENYAQELRDKAEALAELPGLRWHAIGPLQSNKAKYVARSAHSFHALDRAEIGRELSKRRTGEPLPCFIEVTLGSEATKGGVAPDAVPGLLDEVRDLPGIRVIGLMSLPPLGPTPDASRPHFRRLRELGARLGLPELSMGTTADFEVAIEEGATCVRVGTAIFGARPALGATSP